MLWLWANDPETRAHSFQHDPIAWDEHCEWLLTHDPYIGEIEGKPVGTVRIDGNVISVTVAPEHRGHGYGMMLIRQATATSTAEVHAYIKNDNYASIRSFLASGYEIQGEDNGSLHLLHD
jgi:GNAT superfamily N-acetyltransferase